MYKIATPNTDYNFRNNFVNNNNNFGNNNFNNNNGYNNNFNNNNFNNNNNNKTNNHYATLISGSASRTLSTICSYPDGTVPNYDRRTRLEKWERFDDEQESEKEKEKDVGLVDDIEESWLY